MGGVRRNLRRYRCAPRALIGCCLISISAMDRFPAIVPLIGRDATTAYVLIFGLLGISGTDALGQQYPFLPVAGSPTSVTTLFQDSRGRLWVGGRESALFDGARFFPLRDYGYPPGESYVFAEDSSGVMWISSETGVYRFAGGRLERVSQGFAVELFVIRPDLAIAAMGPLGKGVPAKRTLCRIQRVGKGWKTQAVMTLDSPGCVGLEDGKTIAYPGPGKGWSELRLADVLRWQAGDPAPTPIRHPAPLVAGNPDIWIALDPFGCLWMG